jgi:alkylation response protein AidB-like acyl-CoA dehydrogenase
MTTDVRTADFIQRARDLAPITAQYRDQGEEERHLPAPLAAAMREKGLFSLWLPKALGGPQVSLETSVQVTEELSRQDGSVGWNSMIAGNTSVLWGYITQEAAERCVKGDPNTVLAGTVGGGGDANSPGGGVATPVAGGYRLTGKWGFASGCHQADWLVANGRIMENGEVRRNEAGAIGLFSFILPIAECTILDTWYTTGMRGSGSHHFEATDVFVPEERVFSSLNPKPFQPGQLYITPRTTPWAPNIAGVALGIARDAIDTFLEIANSKPAALGRSSLMDRETIHYRVGEAEAKWRSGRAFLLDTCREIDRYLRDDLPIPDELVAMSRLAASNATASSAEVVDSMFTAGGTTSVFVPNHLDRCFRDVHMVTQHGVGGLAGFTIAGRWFMGLGLPGMGQAPQPRP